MNLCARSVYCIPGTGLGSLTLAPVAHCKAKMVAKASLQLMYQGQGSKVGRPQSHPQAGGDSSTVTLKLPHHQASLPPMVLYHLRDMSALT